ncbi:MAG: hypothetical protein KDD21_04730 [Bacteroidetes bacterium]|nr:hypothetical protein [Bacteroidota bacterium]
MKNSIIKSSNYFYFKNIFSFKKFYSLFLVISILTISCSKEENNPDEKWEFTKIVNIATDNNGYMKTLDFYQKKGNEWRIVRMEPDDYTKFYLKEIITPDEYMLPIKNENAFMTCDAELFDPETNKIHTQNKIKWIEGSPVLFNATLNFNNVFTDISPAFNTINKFSGATYSYEKAYDNNDKTQTYMLYDFPNQKYLYYGFRDGADLLLSYPLSDLCVNANKIDWKNIDAVTCTNDKDNESLYYFFDFDAQKMYILNRINKNTNNPSFTFDTYNVYNFAENFKGKSGTAEENAPFDFSK